MITDAATEWIKLSKAARAAEDAFNAQAIIVDRLRRQIAANERVLAELAADRDDAADTARAALAAMYTDEDAEDGDPEDGRDDDEAEDRAYDAEGNR